MLVTFIGSTHSPNLLIGSDELNMPGPLAHIHQARKPTQSRVQTHIVQHKLYFDRIHRRIADVSAQKTGINAANAGMDYSSCQY